jgi:3-oxoacyl-[acyl-carrier-protein] synthase III
MNDVFIVKMAAFLPNEPVNNDEIEEVLGFISGKPSRAKKIILKSNGIKQRHYCIDKQTKKPLFNNAKLTAEAVKKLMSGEKIDILSCGTSTPDQTAPGHAPMVQGELGLPSTEVVSMSGICLSGITAMKYAFASISAGLAKIAITTGSEVVSTMLNAKNYEAEQSHKINELSKKPEIAFEKDFLRWMLSDGAGAAMLSDEPNRESLSLKIKWIDIYSYAGEMPICMYSGGKPDGNGGLIGYREFDNIDDILTESILTVSQDVKLLNENIVAYAVEKPLSDIVRKRGLRVQDIDYFLPHYSSEYFRDKMFDGMKRIDFAVPQDKWFTNLTYKGNTGSASMYIILEELFNSNKLKEGENILCFIPESGRFSAGFILLEVV